MRFTFPFVVFVLSGFTAYPQGYQFDLPLSDSEFHVEADSGRVICLFPLPARKGTAEYLSISFNDRLERVDTVIFRMPAKSRLYNTESTEKFTVYIFKCVTKEGQFLKFIVTYKSGKIHAVFEKSLADLAPLMQKNLLNLSQVELSIMESRGSPDMLLFRPYWINGEFSLPGMITAYSLDDGHTLWTLHNFLVNRIVTTKNEMVCIMGSENGSMNMLNVYDKHTGALIHREAVDSSGRRRSLLVLAASKNEVMVAGTEYPAQGEKEGHSYFSIYDLTGKLLVDHTDSANFFSERRMHISGYAFSDEGNLIIFGEAWKPNYKRAVAGAAGALFQAYQASRSRVFIPVNVPGTDQKVTSIEVATISRQNGMLKDYKSIPVGPWRQFSRLSVTGEQALILNGRNVLSYDLNSSEALLLPFLELLPGDKLVISAKVPLLIHQIGKSVSLKYARTRK